jgi:hypothetical protein
LLKRHGTLTQKDDLEQCGVLSTTIPTKKQAQQENNNSDMLHHLLDHDRETRLFVMSLLQEQRESFVAEMKTMKESLSLMSDNNNNNRLEVAALLRDFLAIAL